MLQVVELPVVGSSFARFTIPTGVFPIFNRWSLSRELSCVELQRIAARPSHMEPWMVLVISLRTRSLNLGVVVWSICVHRV
jgi:hypothetical protein